MKKYLSNRMYLTISVIFAVFSVILAATNILGGDDILWTLEESRHDVFGDTSVNGRYLTNLLTFVAVRVWIVRFLIAFVFVFLLQQLLLRVLSADWEVPGWASVIAAVALLTLNPGLFNQTLNWISGLTNYVISSVLLMIFFLYCKPLLCGKKLEYPEYTAAFMLPLGIALSLCVENVTIYSICLVVFFIVYSRRIYRHVHAGLIAYLIGAVVGAVLMFTNHTYSTLFGSNIDDVGSRSLTVSFADIIHQVYEEVIFYYSAPFWILHIVICVSFLFLYSDKFGGEHGTPPKYTVPAFTVVILYTAYTFFSCVFGDFSVWNAALTIRSLETAFTFLYIVSLFFLGSKLCSRQSYIRFALYLASTIIVSAPFAVVNPVSGRCFFADFIFWVLAAGELSCSVSATHNFERCYPLRLVSVVSCGFIAFTIAYMCTWNKYTDIMRYNYLRKQLDEGKNSIEFIELPYQDYVPCDELISYKEVIDETNKQNSFDENKYLTNTSLRLGREVLAAHGITENVRKMNIIIISLYDYDLKQ